MTSNSIRSVRAKDIAVRLGGSRNSVTGILQLLLQFGEGARLILINDDASPVNQRLREVGAWLGSMIDVESIDPETRAKQIKLKGYKRNWHWMKRSTSG